MKNQRSIKSKLFVTATCLSAAALVAAVTLPNSGCGGGGNPLTSGLGGMIGVGGGGGGSGGGLGSTFLGGKEGAYLDAAFQAGEAFTLGESKEVALGQAVALSLTNAPYSLLDDTDLIDYVTKVGLAVAMVSARPDFTYAFGVLDSDEIAAYSGPRGYIFVTRGALASMKDEAELAAVLAHEVAHVARKHGLNAVRNKKLAGAGATAGSAALAAETNVGFLGETAGTVFEEVVTKGYSQSQETEADKDAVGYLVAAGYDPNGLTRFLTRMDGLGASRRNVLSTHPGIDQRVKTVGNLIKQMNNPTGQTVAARYQQKTASLRPQT